MSFTQTDQFKNKLQGYPDWDREEQIKRNFKALKKLEKLRQQRIKMSDDEAKAREDFFKEFQKNIDNNRPVGAKLYSET